MMIKKMKKVVIGLVLGITAVSIAFGSVGTVGTVEAQAATKAKAKTITVKSFVRQKNGDICSIKFNKIEGSKRYEVQFSYSKKFKSKKRVLLAGTKKVTSKYNTEDFSNSYLRTNKSIYVRVRYQSKNGKWSKFSNVKKLSNPYKCKLIKVYPPEGVSGGVDGYGTQWIREK